MGSERPAGDRRDFLRSIARDGIQSATQLIGAVGLIRDEAGSVAGAFRDTAGGEPGGGVQPPRRRAAEASLDLPADAGLVAAGAPRHDAAFASPLRDDEHGVIALDVRALPATILERRADSAAAIAALLAVDAIAPGPIRALAARLALELAGAGGEGGRSARLAAASAALRNADPLSDALEAALSGVDLPPHGDLAARLAATLERVPAGAPIATTAGLGATSWGDLAPVHEALRRRGAAVLIAAGPTVDPAGVTRLGGIDAADALRAGLDATLLDEAALGARILAGEVGGLVLCAIARAADGTLLSPSGSAVLVALARVAKIPVVAVAPPMRAAPPADAAALAARITERRARDAAPLLARGAAAGVLVDAPRYDVVGARGIAIVD